MAKRIVPWLLLLTLKAHGFYTLTIVTKTRPTSTSNTFSLKQQQQIFPISSNDTVFTSSSGSNQQKDGDSVETQSNSSSSSVAGATFSLIKAIIGAGSMALPSGLAAMTDHTKLLWPASLLMLTLGALSAYTFVLYGRLAHAVQATSLSDLWQRIQGGSSKAISIANFFFCFGCCLSFSLVIGDSLSSPLNAAFAKPISSSTLLPQQLLSRQSAILSVTMAILLPLCNLPSLASLAPVSLVGVVGSILSTLFVAIRCPAIIPSSPYAVTPSTSSSSFFQSLSTHHRPQFNTYNRINSFAPLVLVSMACVAWMGHFSAPEFYQSLVDQRQPPPRDNTNPSTASVALKRFYQMAFSAYTAVAVINLTLLSCGFLTFGGNSCGMILNNYARVDAGALVSRFLIAVSVIGGFPFVFSSCRASAMDLLPSPEQVRDNDKPTKVTNQVKKRRKVTMVLLALITAISLVVKDSGFVVSFNGALMGTAIIYIFPAMLFLKHTATTTDKSSMGRGRRIRLERWFCRFLILFGGCSAILGAFSSVLNSYFSHLLR